MVKLSFFFNVPDINPRTLCSCQPTAFASSAIEAPLARFSRPTICVDFVAEATDFRGFGVFLIIAMVPCSGSRSIPLPYHPKPAMRADVQNVSGSAIRSTLTNATNACLPVEVQHVLQTLGRVDKQDSQISGSLIQGSFAGGYNDPGFDERQRMGLS